MELIILFNSLQNIAFINQELVAQGYAEWMEDDEEEEGVSDEAQMPVLVQ